MMCAYLRTFQAMFVEKAKYYHYNYVMLNFN